MKSEFWRSRRPACMRSRAILVSASLALIGLAGPQAQAQSATSGNLRSGQSELSANPFVALGFNPVTQQVTGYVAALRTAPGHTDECKFLFRGAKGADGMARLALTDLATGEVSGQAPEGPVILRATGNNVQIELPKALAPGECDWILGFIGEPEVRTVGDRFVLSATVGQKHDWIALALVRSRRAYFHQMPDARTVRKAFVVAGDLVHVMEEKPGWYHVRYGRAGKETSGWIKTSDTVQF